MAYDPFDVVRDFEAALCEYTGAPYAVAVNSCTMALLLAVRWFVDPVIGMEVSIPMRTYIGVPMSIVNAGAKVTFRDEYWEGAYRLEPLPVWDSARWIYRGMWHDFSGDWICLSFHTSKTLGDTQGGAILLDDADAYAWFKRMRFDGRTEGVAPKDDHFTEIGFHCYMSPDVAARLMWKLARLPDYNAPLPNDDYPDLSKLEVFK